MGKEGCNMNKILNDLIYLSIDLNREKSKSLAKLDKIIHELKHEMYKLYKLSIPFVPETSRIDSCFYYCPYF